MPPFQLLVLQASLSRWVLRRFEVVRDFDFTGKLIFNRQIHFWFCRDCTVSDIRLVLPAHLTADSHPLWSVELSFRDFKVLLASPFKSTMSNFAAIVKSDRSDEAAFAAILSRSLFPNEFAAVMAVPEIAAALPANSEYEIEHPCLANSQIVHYGVVQKYTHAGCGSTHSRFVILLSSSAMLWRDRVVRVDEVCVGPTPAAIQRFHVAPDDPTHFSIVARCPRDLVIRSFCFSTTTPEQCIGWISALEDTLRGRAVRCSVELPVSLEPSVPRRWSVSARRNGDSSKIRIASFSPSLLLSFPTNSMAGSI